MTYTKHSWGLVKHLSPHHCLNIDTGRTLQIEEERHDPTTTTVAWDEWQRGEAVECAPELFYAALRDALTRIDNFVTNPENPRKREKKQL